MQKDQRFWNAIALASFLALCSLSFLVLNLYPTPDFPKFGFLDLLLLGLGTFRLVHLLTYDKIFDIVRDSVLEGRGNKLRKAGRGWRRLVREFLECIWCTGMWSGLFTVTIYFLGPWGKLAVIVLAVAGLGSIFQVISKTVAESAK